VKRLKGKLLLLFLVIIIAVAVYYSSLPAPEPTLALTQIYGLELQPGQTVEINVTISDISGLSSVSVDLAWDPYVLKVETGDPNGWMHPIRGINYSVYEGGFLKSFSNTSRLIINDIDNDAGTISALYTGIQEEGTTATGSGTLAIIKFSCVNPGITTIEITGPINGHASVEGSTARIPHKEVYGLITNAGPPPIWRESGFLMTVIIAESVITVMVVSAIVMLTRPRSEEEEEFEEEEE